MLARLIDDPRSIQVRRQPGILIADDLGLILTLLKLELEPRGFRVWQAGDGRQAVELYLLHRREIDLVLLDVQMPVLDGPQTLDVLQGVDPEILACFMTGSSGEYSEKDLRERGAVCAFRKPFRPKEIGDFLEHLLESTALGIPPPALLQSTS